MTGVGIPTDYPVYVGVWTNWSRGGRLTGSTITLSQRNGALLTAFLALFITFTGSRLWRIICLTLHQYFQTYLPQDGLHHQRQAILRNSINEKASLWSFIRIFWAWRGRAKQPFCRLLPVIVLSLFATAGFSIGSILSSKISSAMGNEVLLSTSECGTPLGSTYGSSTEGKGDQIVRTFNPWFAEKVTSSANFVQTCYGNSSGNCGPYVRKRLFSTIDNNASCPFKQQQICRHTTGNIKIDSGYLDTQNDLGINAPIDLQFHFRMINHCAPIRTVGYTGSVQYSTGKSYVRYFYGPTSVENLSMSENSTSYTYVTEQQSAEEVAWRNVSTDAQYEVT